MAAIRDSEHYRPALRIVLLYAVFAGLWIYFSRSPRAESIGNIPRRAG